MKTLWLCLIFMFMSGCTTIRTHVTTFHTENHQKGTIKVMPLNETQSDSLEFKFVQAALIRNLQKVGFTPVDSQSESQFKALLSYGVDDGKTVTSTMPLYGQIGYDSYHVEKVIADPQSGQETIYHSVNMMPRYGVVADMPTVSTEYKRTVTIDIYKMGQQTEKRYEIKAYSIGACANAAMVAVPMIEAIFKIFPSPNGVPQRVSIEAKDFNC